MASLHVVCLFGLIFMGCPVLCSYLLYFLYLIVFRHILGNFSFTFFYFLSFFYFLLLLLLLFISYYLIFILLVDCVLVYFVLLSVVIKVNPVGRMVASVQRVMF